MLPRKRMPTSPGEMLSEGFLKPMGLTQAAFAEHLGVPVQRVNEIIKGKRRVTAETAWLFSQALKTTPEFWLSAQAAYDLAVERQKGVRRVPALRVVKSG